MQNTSNYSSDSNGSDMRSLQKLQQKYMNFNIKPYLNSGLPKHEILRLKEAFDLFDSNFNNYINIDDWQISLNEMGICSKNQALMKWKDDNITRVDFNLFLEIMGAKVTCKNKEDVRKLFVVFWGDDDITQKLSKEHFERVWNELGLSLADDEIEEMLRSVITEEEGMISFDEFYRVMTKI